MVALATELEIKLSLEGGAAGDAERWLARQSGDTSPEAVALVNRYFDTPDAELNRARAALRVRRAGARYIQTLKTQGEFVDGAHRRQEWEWELPGPELDVGLLAQTPLANRINLADLQVVFETNFQRKIWLLETPAASVEAALDEGVIAGGGVDVPLHEVEFELKVGASSCLLDWARALAEQVPVFLNLISKAEQGYYLAGLYQPEMPPKGAGLSVNDSLRALSVSWLLDRPFPLADYDVARLESLSEARGVQDLWQAVKTGLSQGRPLRSLLDQTELGRWQLALASG